MTIKKTRKGKRGLKASEQSIDVLSGADHGAATDQDTLGNSAVAAAMSSGPGADTSGAEFADEEGGYSLLDAAAQGEGQGTADADEGGGAVPAAEGGGQVEEVPDEEAAPEAEVDGEVSAEPVEPAPDPVDSVDEAPPPDVAPADPGAPPRSEGFTPMPEPGPAQNQFGSAVAPAAPDVSVQGVTQGQDAYYASISGTPLTDDVAVVNTQVSNLVAVADTHITELVSTGQSAIADSSSQLQGTSSQVRATGANLQSDVSSVATGAAEGLRSTAAGHVASVDTAAMSVADRVATLSENQRAQIDSRSSQLETEVQAKAIEYSAEIDGFITTEVGALETRLDAIIAIIEAESKTELAAAEATGKGYSGDTAGAAPAAEAVAGDIAKAKTKATYANSFKRVKASIISELRTQIGNPSQLLSGNLTAPTLANIFPASQVYADNLDKKKEEGQQKSAEAAVAYGELTIQSADEQAQAIEQSGQAASETVDEVAGALDQDLQRVDSQVASESEEVTSQVAADRAQMMAMLAAMVDGLDGTPGSARWGEYSAQFEAQLDSETNEVTQAVQQGAQDKSDEAQSQADQVMDQTQQATNQVSQGIDEQAGQAQGAMQEGASQTFADLEHVASSSQESGDALHAEAMGTADQALADLDADASSFLETRVKQTVADYSTAADTTFADFTAKMDNAIQTAASGAAGKEASDRRGRRKKAFDAMDGMGTSEGKLMSAVSGVSKVQGFALQGEYASQHGESLRDAIIDDTSGSLMRSLLAWIVGDEQTAVVEAMDYAANSFWGPDTEAAEAALRGLSQEGRDALKADPAFESSRDRLLTRTKVAAAPHGTLWGWDVHDLNTIEALSDLSTSKDEAEVMADAIRLEDAMDRLGTDEAGVYGVLGKRDRAGNEKLAAAYAKYTYERRVEMAGMGTPWEDLPEEARRQLESGSLNDALDDDFSGWEQDKSMALEVGNKGAVRAAELEGSSSGSNDYKAAYDAMKNEGMTQSCDWLAGVTATEEQGEFLHSMNQYQSGADRDDLRAGLGDWDKQEQHQANADNYEQNQQATSAWIDDEFGGSGADETITGVMQDQLAKGVANVVDLMELGVDTTGTREKFVREALDSIAAESDINVRLTKLAELGTYCGGFYTGEIAKIQDARAKQAEIDRCQSSASEGMGKLPAYVDEIEGHGDLRGQIRSIMLVLALESSGGELFDFQLILAKATMRTDNVDDYWSHAEQQLLSMLEGADTADPSAKVLAFVNESTADTAARVDEEWAKALAGELDEDQTAGDHYLSPDDVLIAHYLKAKKSYEAGAGVWFDGEGWLKQDSNGQVAESTTNSWKQFKATCDRVEYAKTDAESHNQRLSNAITAAVAVVAGVVIGIVSFGTATAASALLINLAVTLVTGTITIVTKMAVHGDRYGSEDMLIDMGKVLADVALAAITAGAGSFKGIGKMLDEAVENASLGMKLLAEAGKALPGELMGILTNEAYWDDGNWDQMATDLILGMFKAMAAGGISEGAGALKDIEKVDAKVGRIMDSLLGAMTDVVVDPRKWDDPNMGWDLLKGMGKAAFTSAMGTGILDAQLGRLNAPGYVMSSADWEHIKGTKKPVRDWFHDNLDSRHTSTHADGGAP